jgi:hypothetical protein
VAASLEKSLSRIHMMMKSITIYSSHISERAKVLPKQRPHFQPPMLWPLVLCWGLNLSRYNMESKDWELILNALDRYMSIYNVIKGEKEAFWRDKNTIEKFRKYLIDINAFDD